MLIIYNFKLLLIKVYLKAWASWRLNNYDCKINYINCGCIVIDCPITLIVITQSTTLQVQKTLFNKNIINSNKNDRLSKSQ